MTHSASILQELVSASPAGLSTSELCARTGIASRSSVYHAARELMLQGVVRGERSGHNWRFFVVHTAPLEEPTAITEPPPEFAPLADFNENQMRSNAGWQARYLAPLLELPQERYWFMRKLASPCTQLECEDALLFQHVHLLRDLMYADAQQVRGERRLEDAFIRYYNSLLSLPENFGIEHVWRSRTDEHLRLPGESGRAGWTDGHLQAVAASKKQLRKLQGIVKLLKLENDVVLYSPRAILLVQVFAPGAKVELKVFEKLRRCAAVLERRLQRSVQYGFVVERVEFLPAVDLLFVTCEDVLNHLQTARLALSSGGQDAAG